MGGNAVLRITLAVLATLILVSGTCRASKDKVSPDWEPLISRLVLDGEEEGGIRALFSRPEMAFDPRVMPRKLTHKESKLDYGKFLKPARVRRAKTFLDENMALLQEVEGLYGVPKEIEVAILLVETDLGRYLGAGPALNILASMALASDIEQVRPWLPPELLVPGEREKVERKLEKKSAWAYDELRALLRYARENDFDILAMKGSIFGAIGLCQFMPTNALSFGVDHDGDGRVDLYARKDAMASMANYVRHYGWRPGLDRAEQIKVILKYNYSRPYANTILDVAGLLGWKGTNGKTSGSTGS
jgi:membrane-bound lytic murein transglycosylase B